MKHDIKSNIACFKARQMIKSYQQQQDIYFNHTYVIVMKTIILKILFIITTYYNFDNN